MFFNPSMKSNDVEKDELLKFAIALCYEGGVAPEDCWMITDCINSNMPAKPAQQASESKSQGDTVHLKLSELIDVPSKPVKTLLLSEMISPSSHQVVTTPSFSLERELFGVSNLTGRTTFRNYLS